MSAGHWDAAAGKWRPSTRNACPRCGGILSSAASAERCVLGDGHGGVGASYGLYRTCQDCGAEVLQLEESGSFVGEPTTATTPSGTLAR